MEISFLDTRKSWVLNRLVYENIGEISCNVATCCTLLRYPWPGRAVEIIRPQHPSLNISPKDTRKSWTLNRLVYEISKRFGVGICHLQDNCYIIGGIRERF